MGLKFIRIWFILWKLFLKTAHVRCLQSEIANYLIEIAELNSIFSHVFKRY